MDKRFNYRDIEGYYKDEGTGVPLVFIHGFCADGRIWDDFAKPFKSNYRIIIPDLPGYRNSGLPNVAPSMEIMAEFINAMLKHARIEKAVLVGHSMGGYAALVFARMYPNMINKLVLFHSHVYKDDIEIRKNREKLIQFVSKHGVKLIVKELYTNMMSRKFREEQPELFRQVIDQFSIYPTNTINFSSIAMLNRKDESAVIQSAAYPVMFIIGEEDDSIPFNKFILQTSYPDVSSVHVIKGISHFGMYEGKAIIKHFIEEFCKLTL